jgi:hypothetical protein
VEVEEISICDMLISLKEGRVVDRIAQIIQSHHCETVRKNREEVVQSIYLDRFQIFLDRTSPQFSLPFTEYCQLVNRYIPTRAIQGGLEMQQREQCPYCRTRLCVHVGLNCLLRP